eukprot:1258702-Amphidinium_carterae.1
MVLSRLSMRSREATDNPIDPEVRARLALSPHTQLHRIHAHQTQQAVVDGWVFMEDFQGNQEADVVVNLGAAEHVPHEPSADYLFWEVVATLLRWWSHRCL